MFFCIGHVSFLICVLLYDSFINHIDLDLFPMYFYLGDDQFLCKILGEQTKITWGATVRKIGNIAITEI